MAIVCVRQIFRKIVCVSQIRKKVNYGRCVAEDSGCWCNIICSETLPWPPELACPKVQQIQPEGLDRKIYCHQEVIKESELE